MVRTCDKAVRDAVRNHLIGFYDGSYEACRADMEHVMQDCNIYTKVKLYPSVGDAVRHLYNEPKYLWQTVDIIEFLHSLGFTDDDRLERYRGNGGGPVGLYLTLLITEARDIMRGEYHDL